jgi:hypothetical protein
MFAVELPVAGHLQYMKESVRRLIWAVAQMMWDVEH